MAPLPLNRYYPKGDPKLDSRHSSDLSLSRVVTPDSGPPARPEAANLVVRVLLSLQLRLTG